MGVSTFIAWFDVVLVVLLSVIFILRKIGKRSTRLKWINKKLRKLHKPLGICLVVTGAIHGVLSSQSLISLNIGTMTWLFSILLGMSFYFRKKFRKVSWIKIHRILTFALVSFLVIHITTQIEPANQQEDIFIATAVSDVDSDFNSDANLYKPGVYTGVADAFGPSLTVEVTVSESAIELIEIVSHNEKKKQIYGPAMEQVPQDIIQYQSTEVDDVSGATYTSIGIKEAVESALMDAKI